VAVWDDVIPQAEQRAYERAGWGGRVGFGERPALLIVDMNNAFVHPDYPFSSPPALACAKNIRVLLETARGAGVPVIYTTAARPRNKAEIGRWKANAWQTPAMADPDSLRVYPLLAPRPDESVIEKYSPSAFAGTNLVSLLTFHRIDTVILTGTVTSGCVRATALDAFNLNYRVTIPEECVSDRGAVSHKVALFEIHMKYGDVIAMDDVATYLDEIGATPQAAAPGSDPR
jgi:maleamate amidohydrolase